MPNTLKHDELRVRSRQLLNGFTVAALLLVATVAGSYYLLHRAQQVQFLIESVVVDTNDLQFQVAESFERSRDFRTASDTQSSSKRLLDKIRRKVTNNAIEIERLDESIQVSLATLARLGAPAHQSVYLGETYDISENLALYTSRLETLGSHSGQLSGTIKWMPIDATGAAAGKMLRGLEDLRGQLVTSLQNNGQQLSRYQLLATIFTILVLVAATLFIVLPSMKSLRRAQTDLVSANEQLARQAYYDGETDLLNEAGLTHLTDTDTEYTGVAVFQTSNSAVIERVVGLDRIGEFYNSLALKLTDLFGPACRYARTGDSELSVCFTGRQSDIAQHDWEAIRRETAKGFTVNHRVVTPDIAIGIAQVTSDVKTDNPVATLLTDARLAALLTDRTNRIATFEPGMRSSAEDGNRLIDEIRAGIANREFLPFYQLKYNADTRTPEGMEALCRWRKADGSLVSPGQFIPVAESTGLITDITWLLLEQIHNDLTAWRRLNVLPGKIAFNAATWSLREVDFCERLTALFGAESLMSLIEVEITENVAISDGKDDVRSVVNSLREAGFSIALDDFGTGYASLGTLINLPFDTLKLDRSFVKDIAASKASRTIVETMVNIANTLSVTCVAEGVEEEVQVQHLQEMGCDQIQGFYFHKPASFNEVTRVLQSAFPDARDLYAA